MDTRTLRDTLTDSPAPDLLDAVDGGQDRHNILPLLEAELERSSSRLQRLKEHRNSLASPMYRLQPEVLSDIFLVYAQENDELFNLRWTRLFFVCRRWYNIAINTQVLWSFIDVNPARNYPPHGHSDIVDESDARDIRRIEAQRSRAGLSPIHIRLSIPGAVSEAKSAYCRMFWEPSRTLSLDIAGGRTFIDGIVRSMAVHRHPRLESLSLRSFHGPPSEPAGSQEHLDVILMDIMPKLQHLSVYGVFSGVFPDFTLLRGLCGLRSLRIIEHMYASGALPFTLQDIISGLSRCPELEILNIALPLASQPDAVVSSPAVPMVRLHVIIVQSTLSMCTGLLQALTDIPASAKVLVTSTEGVSNVSSISPLMAYMSDHALCQHTPAIRSIAIHSISLPTPFAPGFAAPDAGLPAQFGAGAPRLRLGILAQSLPIRFEDGQYRRPFTDESDESSYIGLETEVLKSIEDEFISCVFRSWPLFKATHLDLRPAQMDTSHITPLLASLPAMTTVIVRPEVTNVTKALVAALRAYLREHGRRAVAHVVFDVRNANDYVARGTWNGAIVRPSSAGALARQSMMHMLAYCAEAARAGVPLDTLEIVNEPQKSTHRMLNGIEGVEWSELNRDFQMGFVYEGVLHSGRRELDGTKRDSFAVANE
ncbi:hypothetical protein PENSPDRAFT_750361 [Peniophora sp. CONT]|nr:hypothetical protein PENSPDRAFT_750361 [Peniophora sp. CONT]